MTRVPLDTDRAPWTADTLDWLLGGDALVRWQTRRDLLDEPPERCGHDRADVATSGWGHRLLECQDRDGTWGGGLYSPKWTSTTYSLLLLRRFGLAPGHPQALRGVERIWDGARYFDGGLTAAVTIDVPEACITSMYVALARYFGFEDQRVTAAVEWLLANQLTDGGWNCRAARFGDRHSSFHTSILAMEALAESHPVGPRQSEITSALATGTEFFLSHRLFKSHRHDTIVDPAFTRLSFPPRWHYDILRGLDHFAKIGAPWDERYTDAIDILVGRRRLDGRWPVQNKHPGRAWFEMEPIGEPSRWNTLRALRVLQWSARRPGG